MFHSLDQQVRYWGRMGSNMFGPSHVLDACRAMHVFLGEDPNEANVPTPTTEEHGMDEMLDYARNLHCRVCARIRAVAIEDEGYTEWLDTCDDAQCWAE